MHRKKNERSFIELVIITKTSIGDMQTLKTTHKKSGDSLQYAITLA